MMFIDGLLFGLGFFIAFSGVIIFIIAMLKNKIKSKKSTTVIDYQMLDELEQKVTADEDYLLVQKVKEYKSDLKQQGEFDQEDFFNYFEIKEDKFIRLIEDNNSTIVKFDNKVTIDKKE